MDHFRGLFDKLDKNKDGFISTEELQSEMRRIGVEPVCEKVQVRQFFVWNYIGYCYICRDVAKSIHSSGLHYCQ